MPRRRTFLLTCLSVPILAVAPAVRATSIDGAVTHIQALGERAMATLQRRDLSLAQREAAFGRILRAGFDLRLIGRFVIGKYWRQASNEEKAEYLEAFGDYVIKTYARRLGGFSGQSFSVTGTQVAGERKDVLVNTSIERPGGASIAAAWRVRDIEGSLKIIDVVVEGVSMAVTQRQEFSAVARRGGMSGLVRTLRAQTERLSATAG